MQHDELQALRKRAELAVADMSDSELKVKAFEVILGHLLVTAGEGADKTPKHETTALTKRRPATAATSMRARILSLKDEGFFANQRTIGDIQAELAAHGWHYPLTNLSGKLQSLVRARELRRMKVNRGNRTLWMYSAP